MLSFEPFAKHVSASNRMIGVQSFLRLTVGVEFPGSVSPECLETVMHPVEMHHVTHVCARRVCEGTSGEAFVCDNNILC